MTEYTTDPLLENNIFKRWNPSYDNTLFNEYEKYRLF